MVDSEFEKAGTRPDFYMPPPMPFPKQGSSDDEVLAGVKELLDQNPYEIENDFGISYVGPPHSISRQVSELAIGTFFVEWAREIQPGPYDLEKQAVRMMASLLGKPDAVGFITNGGTESDISALRLARNLSPSVSEPEVVMPETGHYAFHVAAELMGLRLREAPLGDDMKPDMDQVESLINRNTVALVCSMPGGSFMLLDPAEEFAELARRHNKFLHIDAAFGGFILPFMRELGYDVPRFDFSLEGVSTIMTDGHKLGLMPVATSFFMVRDEEMLKAIPTERTVIHNITATKHGERAASAWAVMRRMGRQGYVESTRRVLELVDFIATGIEQIDGLRLVVKPDITLISFTSDAYDMHRIHEEMLARRWGHVFGSYNGMGYIRLSIHPHRDMDHARGFLAGLRESVDIVRAAT